MNNSQQYPIVLAAGIARFDTLTDTLLKKLNLFLWDFSLAFDRFHFFRGVASYLEAHGFDTHHTSVSFAANVVVRAAELAEQIRAILAETGQEKVHIIGQSMGGLDARQMLYQEREMANKVATLTTIGTPHHGAILADYLLTSGGEHLIESLRPFIDLEGFLSLKVDDRLVFNELAEDWEAKNPVFYQVYAGSQEFEKIFLPLKEPYQFILARRGDNDGLVSVSSQLWTDKLIAENGTVKQIPQKQFPVPADHLNQLAWWDLQELSGTQWWDLDLRREKQAFETAVKEAYLSIAREVTAS